MQVEKVESFEWFQNVNEKNLVEFELTKNDSFRTE